MLKENNDIILNDGQKRKYAGWLTEAYAAAKAYDASEESDRKLLTPLTLMEDFIRSTTKGPSSSKLEEQFAVAAKANWKADIAPTIYNILDKTNEFYDRIEAVDGDDSTLAILEKSGSLILKTESSFVKTDSKTPPMSSTSGGELKFKFQPRLAMLVKYLKNIGIYADDLIIHPGTVDPKMMRQRPYMIVQIPRIDKEIAVCSQVGEITFVGQKIIGPELWDHLSKKQLKAREDINTVRFSHEKKWWEEINNLLSGISPKPKINLKNYSKRNNKLDTDLIKLSILEHYKETEKWPTTQSGNVLYGPYAKKETWYSIDTSLRRGGRGTTKKSSIAKLKKEIAEEHKLEYINKNEKPNLNLDSIKESILEHYKETEKWPTTQSGNVLYGPYAKKETWYSIESNLRQGGRGITKKSSIAKLKKEIAEEHKLEYINKKEKLNLNLDSIKESILEHYKETGTWPAQKSGNVLYGPYAEKDTWSSIENSLKKCGRGIIKKSSIAKLKKEIAEEHKLEYINKNEKPNLNLDSIKESILEHYKETKKWPTAKSGSVLYGPYAKKDTWSSIEGSLHQGSRGITKKSSIAKLKKEIAEKHNLEYKKPKEKPNLNLNSIEECILEHYKETGTWPAQKSGSVLYGPYAERDTWSSIENSLKKCGRGITKKSSLAKLKKEILAKLKEAQPAIPKPHL